MPNISWLLQSSYASDYVCACYTLLFSPPQRGDVGILLYIVNKQNIRQSFQYLIYTLVNYLLIQLIIISGLEHFIGRIINCLRQVGAHACNSNWHWQQRRNSVWWGGSRHISKVTLENLRVGLCSIAPPIGGYDNSQTSPLCNTTPRWRGIIVCPVFHNGQELLIYVLQGSFENIHQRLVSQISSTSMWDI